MMIFQYSVILILFLPFLIPVFRKLYKIIPFFQILIFLSFFIYLFFNKDLLPLKTVFGGWTNAVGIEVLFDYQSLVFLSATYIVFLIVMIYSGSKQRDWKFYFLLNLLLSDLTCLFIANDLFNVYVTLELLSLISYMLISIEFKNRQIWASLKYMILSAVSFNIYLLGTAMIYNQYQTLNLTILSQYRIVDSFPQLLIITALLVKSGIFFFSMWLPSAHSDSESTVSAILSGVIVNAGVFHVFRVSNAVNNPVVNQYIVYVGLASAVAGAWFSIRQKDIKLILAFSTMSQMGFILQGYKGYGAEYAFSHSLYKALLFLAAGYFIQLHGTRNIISKRRKVPLALFIAIWVGYLSISGVPFFLGWVFKHEIILSTQNLVYYGMLFASICSIISVGRIAFNVSPSTNTRKDIPRNLSLLLLSFICVLGGILIGIDHLNLESIAEPLLLFALGVFLFFLLRNRIKISYPYKMFKISNVLGIYAFMIVLIVTMTYFAF